jgi:hypothetical protein
MTFGSITYGWVYGEELEINGELLQSSDCFLTSTDSLYTEGDIAMEMLRSVTSKNWVQSCAEYKDFVPLIACIDYL